MWAIKMYPHHICQVNRRMPGTSSLGLQNKENCIKLAGVYIVIDSLKQQDNLLGYKGYRPQNPIKTKLPGTELAKHVHKGNSAHAGKKKKKVQYT